MPFRIKPDGTIEADSADEAFEMSRRMAAQHSKPPPASKPHAATNGAGWAVFLSLIEGKAMMRKALISVKQGKSTYEDLCKELGYRSNNELTGTISGIKKNVKKAGVEFSDVLVKHGLGYKPGPLLLKSDEDLKMPAG